MRDDPHTTEQSTPAQHQADQAVLAASRRRTRRSFVVGGLATAAAAGFYEWLNRGPQDNMQPLLLRRAMESNAELSRTVLPREALAPTYPLSRAETLRVNGVIGLKKALKPEGWRLQLVGARDAQPGNPRYTPDVTSWNYTYEATGEDADKGHDTKTAPPKADTSTSMSPAPMQGKTKAAPEPAEDEEHRGRAPRGFGEAGESYSTLYKGTSGLLLTLDDIVPKLQRHEFVTQFKCIEGWSQYVHWAGVRMADFLDLYPPAGVDGKEPKFVYMETPDGDYYTGYHLEALRHPQALLVTEMMGAPLTPNHGAPLRLHMPTRYGYKQIKRIGLIEYLNDQPDDYWTELGYDFYAGL